jgi:hypothetical protein
MANTFSGGGDMEAPDFWRKLEIVLSPVGGLLTALAVALVGFLASRYFNQKQEMDARAKVYAELMSQREQSESQLRKDMFDSTIKSFMKPETASLDEKVLNMELLAYNFHETLDLRPLFSYVEHQIAGERDSTQKKGYQQRLHNLARNITRNQMIVLEEDGQKRDLSINLSELGENPEGVALEPVIMSLDEIQRSFVLRVTGVDKIAQELHCELRVEASGNPGDSVYVVPSVGFYDFPVIKNARLSHDQRCAIVLNNLGETSADVTLVLFPGSRAGLKERAFSEDVIRKLQAPSNSKPSK